MQCKGISPSTVRMFKQAAYTLVNTAHSNTSNTAPININTYSNDGVNVSSSNYVPLKHFFSDDDVIVISFAYR